MSVQKLKKSPKDLAAAKGSVSATVKKAFKTNSNWEDKVSLSSCHNLVLLSVRLLLDLKNLFIK